MAWPSTEEAARMSAPATMVTEANVWRRWSRRRNHLRHTLLSPAAAQGVHPSVMMKLAGHKNPNITMKIYTHVNMESKREAMDAMQAAYMLAG